MESLIMAAQLILGLSLLVFVHELGHFLAAKAFGMRVNRFYIFFDAWDKKLFSKKIGETEYGIGWLPLGGYVQIAGMIDETQDAASLSAEPEPWEFRAKPAWQRFIVMIGGIVMNVITGILIFAMYLNVYQKEYLPMEEVNKTGFHVYELAQSIGMQQGDKIIAIDGNKPSRFKDATGVGLFLGNTLTIERNGKTIDLALPDTFYREMRKPFIQPLKSDVYIELIPDNTNAKKAGLKGGDKFVAINGTPIKGYSDLTTVLNNNKEQEVQLTVLRENAEVSITCLVTDEGKLGFLPRFDFKPYYAHQAYDWMNGLSYGSLEGYNVTVSQLIGFGMLFSGKVNPRDSVASPIRIAKTLYGGTWNWPRFWSMTALLSFVLAFMNILPIPALDGGHMMFLSYEIISGQRPSDAFLEKAQIVGFVLIMGLMIFAFGNDIAWLLGY